MVGDPKARAGDRGRSGSPVEKRDDPGGRARWFRHSRQRADGKLPAGLIGRASSQKRRRERELLLKQRSRVGAPPGAPGVGLPPGAAGAPGVSPPPAPPGPGENWASLGPDGVAHGMGGIVSGRITALAVGPGGQRVYAGAANGGVWLSEDGGNTWKPLDQFAVSPTQTGGRLDSDALSVGAIAVRFGSPSSSSSSDSSSSSLSSDILYVGTGEPGNDGYFGIGIKVSTDSGTNFALEGTNLTGSEVYQIVIDPVDPSLVFAATTTGIYRRPAGPGFSTWDKVTDPSGPGGEVTDLVVAGSGASRVYYAAAGDQVFQSSDIFAKPAGSVTWNPVWGLTASGRKALAVGENDRSVVYCLIGGRNGQIINGTSYHLFRLDNGTGGDFRKVDGVPQALFAGQQGDYDLVVAADPADANMVYLMGDLTDDAQGGGDWNWALAFFKGKIAVGPDSFTFPFDTTHNDQTTPGNARTTTKVPDDPTWIGRGIHPDGHALAFASNADGTHDGSVVWVGCDGGVFQSSSSGARGTFVSKNKGLGITQMTYIAVPPDTAEKMYGGSQDNGTLRYTASGTPPWFQAFSGDGGGVAINPRNPSQIIRQWTRATLELSPDDGASWSPDALWPVPARGPEDTATAFYSPIKEYDTGSKTLVAFGTNRLWFRPDWGDPWVTLPTGTDPYQGGSNLTQDVLDTAKSAPVRAIAFGSPTMILVATSDPGATGTVWRLDQSGGKWSVDTKLQPPPIPSPPAPTAVFVADLAVEDVSKGTFYAALGSGGGEHVLYYDGTNWQSAGLSVGTLDVPSHAVVVHPADASTVFLGTDVGVWKGVKSGSTWTWVPFSQGLPESAVTDLAVQISSRKLRAATHGRGVWEIPIDWPTSSSSSSVDGSSSSAAADSSSSSSGDSSSSSAAADSSSSSSEDSSSSSSSADSSSSSSEDGSSSPSSAEDSSSSSSEDSSSSSSSAEDSSSSSSEDSSSSSSAEDSSSSSSEDGSSSSSDDSSSSSDSGAAVPRAPQSGAQKRRPRGRPARPRP